MTTEKAHTIGDLQKKLTELIALGKIALDSRWYGYDDETILIQRCDNDEELAISPCNP